MMLYDQVLAESLQHVCVCVCMVLSLQVFAESLIPSRPVGCFRRSAMFHFCPHILGPNSFGFFSLTVFGRYRAVPPHGAGDMVLMSGRRHGAYVSSRQHRTHVSSSPPSSPCFLSLCVCGCVCVCVREYV